MFPPRCTCAHGSRSRLRCHLICFLFPLHRVVGFLSRCLWLAYDRSHGDRKAHKSKRHTKHQPKRRRHGGDDSASSSASSDPGTSDSDAYGSGGSVASDGGTSSDAGARRAKGTRRGRKGAGKRTKKERATKWGARRGPSPGVAGGGGGGGAGSDESSEETVPKALAVDDD